MRAVTVSVQVGTGTADARIVLGATGPSPPALISPAQPSVPLPLDSPKLLSRFSHPQDAPERGRVAFTPRVGQSEARFFDDLTVSVEITRPPHTRRERSVGDVPRKTEPAAASPRSSCAGISGSKREARPGCQIRPAGARDSPDCRSGPDKDARSILTRHPEVLDEPQAHRGRTLSGRSLRPAAARAASFLSSCRARIYRYVGGASARNPDAGAVLQCGGGEATAKGIELKSSMRCSKRMQS
jgi:hypothetical protein